MTLSTVVYLRTGESFRLTLIDCFSVNCFAILLRRTLRFSAYSSACSMSFSRASSASFSPPNGSAQSRLKWSAKA